MDTTLIINDDLNQENQNIENQSAKPMSDSTTKFNKGKYVAVAAGGFVAGAGVGVATTANASSTSHEAPSDAQTEETIESPAPEQVILANDEGIRYAHVDATNFSDAFAQARQQVGPGGVFEYNGRLYGTYYADEWNKMSTQEKADYQNRVNEVAPSHNHTSSQSADNNIAVHHETTPEVIPANAEMISQDPIDNEIRVLGVETVQNDEGEIMNVALVECEGDQAMLVDVDNNGTFDVLLHDDNGDGQIQEAEVHNIEQANLDVADLLQAQASQAGDMLYASNDDMPDYINDADSMMNV